MISFDEILVSKIKFGYYQIAVFIVLGVIGFLNAFESQLVMLMNPILKNQWNLDSQQVQTLSGLFFLGQMIGRILSGMISDRIGRRLSLILGTIGTFITIFSMYKFANRIEYFYLARFFEGFFLDLIMSLTTITICAIIIL